MATHSSILDSRIPWLLAGCSPWGHKESDTTARLNTCEGWVIFEPSDHVRTQNIHEGTLWSQLLLP